ncbi:MAG: type II toxin-antitoxin system PemK/MazF family toxin [Candidatus Eremiobacterota bacterium]
MTDALKGIREFPGHIIIPSCMGGCNKDSIIMTEQIRLIRRTRIIEITGTLPDYKIREIDEALKFVLSLL